MGSKRNNGGKSTSALTGGADPGVEEGESGRAAKVQRAGRGREKEEGGGGGGGGEGGARGRGGGGGGGDGEWSGYDDGGGNHGHGRRGWTRRSRLTRLAPLINRFGGAHRG